MQSSQYFVAKSDKYVLIRRVGKQNISIVSDINATQIYSIYQKICTQKYASERELFEDIYRQYSNHSIIPFFKE